MCAAELSLGSTKSNMCEDELFQSEVSSGRMSHLKYVRIKSVKLIYGRYLIGTTLFVKVQCPIDKGKKCGCYGIYVSMLSKPCLYTVAIR